MLKANKLNLKKLENLFKDAGYRVRYGKGNFQAGYCINAQQKQIVVNKFYHLEAKFSLLVDIIRDIEVNQEELSKEYLNIYQDIVSSVLDKSQEQS